MTKKAREDLLAEFRSQVLGILVNFGNELLDIVRDSKHVDVEDVRQSVLGAMSTAAGATETGAQGVVHGAQGVVQGVQPSGHDS